MPCPSRGRDCCLRISKECTPRIESLPAMRAVLVDNGRLSIGEAPRPTLGPDDLRISVRATSVNRADLLQAAGRYPPPPGASEILGLECAGVVSEVGSEVSGW